MTDNIEKILDNNASNLVKATLAYARYEFIRESNKALKTTRVEYQNAVSGIIMHDPLKGRIEINGTFPVMLEEGFTSFDEKQGFANSPKTKPRANGKGRYLTIPFRHRTSGVGANVMPKNIMGEARKLKDGSRLGEQLVNALGYQAETSWKGYTRTTSKYTNMERTIKIYESGKKHSQYMTYRRVSDKSDPKSRYHPGFKGVKAFDKAAEKVESFAYDYRENSL